MQSYAGAVLANPLSPDSLLGSSAVLILAIILFAECGLLIGFFLPGDTLLFAAGIKIAIDPGALSPLAVFLIVAPIAAFAGNLLGYWIGYRAGPRVFDRPDSRIFRPEYVARSEVFFARWGSWTILVGRFVPIVRTVATVMAGVARMRFATYAIYSAIGALIWADGMLILGRELGKIDFVQRNKGYVDYAVIVVVVLALLPALANYVQGRRRNAS
jgi:membrane-associated protein